MSKSLIIYFSRADENYSVGYISKDFKALQDPVKRSLHVPSEKKPADSRSGPDIYDYPIS